jgi:hypothetical protein
MSVSVKSFIKTSIKIRKETRFLFRRVSGV